MSVVGSLIEVGTALVVVGVLLKQRSEEATPEPQLVPVPVREPRR